MKTRRRIGPRMTPHKRRGPLKPKRKPQTRSAKMQNYSQVFQDAINAFESPYVPGDQGDAGKGQVTARAGYTINQSNPNVGYISKSPGQTQYYGIAVDAIKDRSDGSGADYLTDELQPDGRRLIKVAYTPYATPPPGTPVTDWQQPTADMLEKGGPLVLKADTPEPEPTPPPADNSEVLAAIEAMKQEMVAGFVSLSQQQASDTNTILAAVQHLEDRLNQVVEDMETTAMKLAPILLKLFREADDDNSGGIITDPSAIRILAAFLGRR